MKKLESEARFGPWLFRIAHNEAYSLFRKRRPETDLEDLAVEPGVSPFPIELTVAVGRALDRLSPDQREAVILKIYQGFKFDEMAAILDCPVSTVKSRVYTALDLLKAELAPLQARGVS